MNNVWHMVMDDWANLESGIRVLGGSKLSKSIKLIATVNNEEGMLA